MCVYVCTGVCYTSSISKRANFVDIVFAQMISRVLSTEGMRGMLRSSSLLVIRASPFWKGMEE